MSGYLALAASRKALVGHYATALGTIRGTDLQIRILECEGTIHNHDASSYWCIEGVHLDRSTRRGIGFRGGFDLIPPIFQWDKHGNGFYASTILVESPKYPVSGIWCGTTNQEPETSETNDSGHHS